MLTTLTFSIELLPGPRDRDGLPDSLRFWKTRIEDKDADATFTVGLIYGPSGCGKSSLVKAGLIPRLSEDVIAVYVEATGEDTETRLLNGLRKRCPALLDNLNLKGTMAALRRGQGIPVGKKVFIVLDQFEQWLHANKEEQDAELLQALRQCEGSRVQCILMVRDDFWLAVSRFLKDLEIRLIERENSALADLFDLAHARKVLGAFGRAFGKLPENPRETTKDQKEFVNKAVSGLAQDGKVISVRLAIFAEMMKGKTWTPTSLKAVGGTEGVGITFLEETFSSATAPPEHRYHQKAARADLRILLPETGSDIKGHMRSYAELLEASGYGNRLRDFEDLIRILDGELRLITPTDPEGKDESSASSSQPGQKYYQLTHDYLVHSLREWLTRKQKETRQGRAELLLSDLAAVWNARPENRQLPTIWQFLSIRSLTTKSLWTPPQQKMMNQAKRYHAARGIALALFLAIASFTGVVIRERVVEKQNATHAIGLVRGLLDADISRVPGIVTEMTAYRKWTDPLLREAYDQDKNPHRKLHASLALLPSDNSQVDYLGRLLLEAAPNEVTVIRDALAPHKEELRNKLRAVLETPAKAGEFQRLRAASALAIFEPASPRWENVAEAVVDDLVKEPAVYLEKWMDSLRPVRLKLLAALATVYGNIDRREVERSLAPDILADFAADQPQILANLLLNADEKQFPIIYPKFREQVEHGLPILTWEINRKLPPELPSSDASRETLARRQANAAVALLRLNQPEKVWPLLKHSPDPRVRSYLIHRFGPLGADSRTIIQQLDAEQDITIRRAIILSLGEFSETEFTTDYRMKLIPKLQEIYSSSDDAGLHAASEWLLRKWKQDAWLKQVNLEWAKDTEKRKQRTASISNLIATSQGKPPAGWYVNSQGQTMVVIPGPISFQMGSARTERDREDREVPHQ